MTADHFFAWKSKRNTGLRLRWSYDTETEREFKYREDNKHFIKLANILHTSQNKEEVWEGIRSKRFLYLITVLEEPKCVGENLNNQKTVELIQSFFTLFPWVSNKPIFENEISKETLEEAQKMFYYLTRCPNYYETAPVLRTFFYKLLNHFPLKTSLITIVRIIDTCLKTKKTNEMRVANELLKKLDEIVGLSINNHQNDTIDTDSPDCKISFYNKHKII